MWLTLIKSNPLFKAKRAEYISDCYNPNGHTAQQVLNIIIGIDKACDKLNEISGNKISVEIMYGKILERLGNAPESIHCELLSKIKLQANELFVQYLPFLLNENILHTLAQLKNDGFNLNISSNTGFIEGKYLVGVMQQLKLFDYFEFSIFSDEINASKPSFAFYQKVFDKMDVQKSEVLHIGDNYKADYLGAINFGFNALYIDNKDYTIRNIKKFLNERAGKF